jgi:hypothetical protein
MRILSQSGARMKLDFALQDEETMDETITGKITKLMQEVFDAGVLEGHRVARADLIAQLSAPPKVAAKRSHHAKPAAPPTPVTTPALPERAAIQSVALAQAVSDALNSLQGDNSDGVFPDAIAAHLKEHGNGQSAVTVQEVRGALRQMTISGEVRRLQRGRYILAQAPDPGTLL